MKTAIVILADPKTGSEEALGRVFNALSAAYDFKQNGEDVSVVFQGTGTRWAGYLTKEDHPFHALYQAVEDKVAGVSWGCATAFGAMADAEAHGFALLNDNPVPGTQGLPSLREMARNGYSILIF